MAPWEIGLWAGIALLVCIIMIASAIANKKRQQRRMEAQARNM